MIFIKLEHKIPTRGLYIYVRNGIQSVDRVSFENTWQVMDTLLISQFIHWMTLTFGIHKGSCTTYFHITAEHCFGKIQGFTFAPFKSPGGQIWPWWKIGQGQPSITIWTYLVVFSHLMLRIKFQSNQLSDSGEEGFFFFSFFSIYDHGSHLSHVTWTIWINFRSLIAKMLHMKSD